MTPDAAPTEVLPPLPLQGFAYGDDGNPCALSIDQVFAYARAAIAADRTIRAGDAPRDVFAELRALTEALLTRADADYLRRCVDAAVKAMAERRCLPPVPWPDEDFGIAVWGRAGDSGPRPINWPYIARREEYTEAEVMSYARETLASNRAGNAAAADGVWVPRELIAFLEGAAPLNGTWFSDVLPDTVGRYWWRKLLRAAASQPPRVDKSAEAADESFGTPSEHSWFSQAALDVTAERRRQIEAEGWTPEHDDEHSDGSLAMIAGCYALKAGGSRMAFGHFPRNKDAWKPGATPRHGLVKAGALVLAEIERIDRALILKD